MVPSVPFLAELALKRGFREGPANATTTRRPQRHPQIIAVNVCPSMWLCRRHLHAHLYLWARNGKQKTLPITAPPVSISAVLRGDNSFSRFYSLFSQLVHYFTLFSPFPPLTFYSSLFLSFLFLLPPLFLCRSISHSLLGPAALTAPVELPPSSGCGSVSLSTFLHVLVCVRTRMCVALMLSVSYGFCMSSWPPFQL